MELPKLPPGEDGTPLYHWLKFLKSETEEDLEMITEKVPEVDLAITYLRELTQDEQVTLMAEAREAWMGDQKAREMRALEEGIEKGLEKGLEQGIEQGIEKNKIETAKALLTLGMTIEQIMAVTNLSQMDIENLK